jgi:hypothetical protein
MQLHEHRYPISLSWQPTKEDEGNAEAAANACVIFTKNNLLPSVKILTFTRSEARSARLGSARLGSARLGAAAAEPVTSGRGTQGSSAAATARATACANRSGIARHAPHTFFGLAPLVLVSTGCVHVS